MSPSRLALAFIFLTLATSAWGQVFINEIHYDNSGTDSGELIEVAGPDGTDVTNWSLVLYNGSNSQVYNTIVLAGSLGNPCGSLGFLHADLPVNGLQNGAPDGIALVDNAGVVREFLSYEGQFVAVGGPADGMPSVDIGVSESSGSPVATSLQLVGDGEVASDFSWIGGGDASPGLCNDGQNEGGGGQGQPVNAFFNEFHYDNAGADSGEAVEIAGPAGLSLAGWSVVLYNGSNQQTYGSIALTGTLEDSCDGFGVLAFDRAGLQNGSPDGLALVDPSGQVAEFLSYEGVINAQDGPAAGLTSVDVGVSETGSTPVGESLQRTGRGIEPSDFGWTGPSPASFGLCNSGQSFGEPEPPAVLRIHAVQGATDASPVAGLRVTIEGVVVGVVANLGGFYVQEEAADQDADPATSEGIFVFSGDPVNVGDLVRVEGQVAEFFGLTELTSSPTVTVLETGLPLPPAALITNYAQEQADGLERLEGMRVTFQEELTVVEYFNLDRFGTVRLSPVGRLFQPTQLMPPGPNAAAQSVLNRSVQVLLDDGSNAQNPDVILHGRNGLPVTADNILRGGDTVATLEGFMHYAFGEYRIQPSGPVQFAARSERTDVPPPVAGSLRLASVNVLNYFVSIEDSRSRGADTPEELARQRQKLVLALERLDADILGLVEIENDLGGEPDAALADLVGLLNASPDSTGNWAFVPTGAIGTDAIKVGFLYKEDRVSLDGAFAVLDSSVDPAFIDTRNRPVLAQTFVESASGERFTAALLHLKSKGSACDDVGDPDQNDGQGNCAQTRRAAARAVVDWLRTDPTGSGDPDYAVLGDLNAYAEEDAVRAFLDADYLNVETAFEADGYSFLFDGQLGTLDYVLAGQCLASQVAGAATWHINADEPDLFDYNLDFGRDPGYFDGSSPARFSDHDPLLVGLDLASLKFSGFRGPLGHGGSLHGLWRRYLPVVFRLRHPDGSGAPGEAVTGALLTETGEVLRTFEFRSTRSGLYVRWLPLRGLPEGVYRVQVNIGDCQTREAVFDLPKPRRHQGRR